MKSNRILRWVLTFWVALFFILSDLRVVQGQGYELRTAREITLLSVGAVGTTASILLRKKREPLSLEEMRELDTNDIFALDRISDGSYRKGAQLASDVLLNTSYALPFTLLAFDETRPDAGTLGVILLQTIALNETLTGITKALVKRPRPFTYNRETPEEVRTRRGNTFSFFSGHTSYTAALSFFTAKTISDYVDKSSVRTIAWTGAFLWPAATGYFRYRAGKHFPSDVIVGYLVGASLGYLIPHIHKADESSTTPETTAGQLPMIQPLFQITFMI
ncbi:MAG: phosphatase PAP2 family protein [Cyclobacteriaceae bacterium]